MRISNRHIGPLRPQMTNTQKKKNSEMSTQKMNNLNVFSWDKTKSKRINVDESESHVCSRDKNKSNGFIVQAFSSAKIE